jgi:hypothetical protein
MPKLQPIDHPAFGRLIPDQWGDDLMCFREFPYLRKLSTADSAQALKEVSQTHRELVENWRDQPVKLAKICRNWGVGEALQAMGVYEVTVPLDGAAEPSQEQASAYRFFGEHEEAICNNACNALLRYYQVARETDEDWFEDNECPKAATLEELFPLVRFDGLSISRSHCEGLSVLFLEWGPDWDVEHGLRMAVWRDQVVGIGLDEVYELVELVDEAVWNTAQMTDAERIALKQLQAGVVMVDETEDEEAYDDEDEETYDDE